MTPKINWNPNSADLRKFGLTILIGFGMIGALVFFKGHRDAGVSIWAISSAVAFLAILMPPMARPFYLVWMGIALIIGSVMSRVVMGVIYFLLITPVALLFRVIGRDALQRRGGAKGKSTYWNEHPKISGDKYYEHLF